jgi:small subunit ribosomal protein S7
MRKHKPKKRGCAPDSRYNDPLVTRFVNNLMFDGKKSTAFAVFYDAMDMVQERGEDKNAHETWKRAMNNAMPQIEVRSRRIGGATFQIPTELPADRKIFMGIRWLITFARKRSGKGIANKLAQEILAAAKNEGAAVKRKEDTHKMAEANRAFAHYGQRRKS